MSSRGDRGRHNRDSPDDFGPTSRSDKKARPNNSSGLNTYWIDGEGIHREVLQRQICFMLGNEARCKPGNYKGIAGYNITAVRPFTQRQLDDLIDLSSDYVSEKERYSRDYERKERKLPPELPYADSRTAAGYDSRRHEEDLYQGSRQPPNQLQDYPSHQNPYQYPSNPGSFPPDGAYPPPGTIPSNAYQASQYGQPNPPPTFRDPYTQPYPPYGSSQPHPGRHTTDPSHPRYLPSMDMGPPDRGQPPQMYPSGNVLSPSGVPYYQYDDDRMDLDPGQPPRHSHRGTVPTGYPPQGRIVYDNDEDFRVPQSSKYQVKVPREEHRDRDRDRDRDRRDRDKYGRR